MPNRNPLSWLSSMGSVLAVLAPKGLCPICMKEVEQAVARLVG